MNKILIYSPLSDHITSTAKFMIFRGLDVKVLFNNTDLFSFTADPEKAHIVCLSASFTDSEMRTLSDLETGKPPPHLLTETCRFYLQFSNAKLFLDMHGLMHVGEGVSDLTRITSESNALARLFKHAGAPAVVTVNTNFSYIYTHQSIPDHLLYTDFLWNRQLVFYKYQPDTVFGSDPDDITTHWYPTEFDTSVYHLNDLDEVCSEDYINRVLVHQNDSLHKKFLAPCRTRGANSLRRELTGYADLDQTPGTGPAVRDFLRTQLIMLLRNYPGYVGDPATGNFLIGQGVNQERLHDQISVAGTLGWTPINNAYYENSVITIYTETVTLTHTSGWFGLELRNLTEKTWEPLIKGHFILPFGYGGMIADLKRHYGVMLPDWIDYSYDDCDNDLERWYLYTQEIKRVLALGAKTLFNYKQQDLHILKHNRNLLMEGGYRDTIETALLKFCTSKPELAQLFDILVNDKQ